MKKKLNAARLILVFLSVILNFVSCTDSGKDSAKEREQIIDGKGKTYTCPMHPEIIRSEPGRCPICHMFLVEIPSPSNTILQLQIDDLIKPTDEFVISEIKTVSPEQLELPVTFRANGYISYDMQNVYSISSRYEGRIEKLYIKYNFQKIEKGQVIFEIYSPELVTAQQDFIFILKNDKDNQTLIDAAKKKLELMGMVENQIAQVAALKLVQYKMPVYSQVSGYIIEESQGRKMATRADKEMGGQSTLPSNPGNKDLLTKEGQYLEKGSTVFKVISNKTVWAELKLFNAGLNVIRKGNDVTVYVDGSTHSIVSTVDQILPIFTESEAYLTARVILENKGGEIKIGALVKSEIVSRQKSALWLKKEAIIDLGIEKVVFQVTSKNLLKVKRIHIGQVSADMVEIREGLNKDDRVAANAEFLMDSESFIKQ